MNDEVREIGGSKLRLRWGKFLERKARKYIDRGNKTIISNPSCNFPNGFTMILTFTVNTSDKYQLVNQGKYVEKYKAQVDTEECPVTQKEMFMMITQSTSRWFKKEL